MAGSGESGATLRAVLEREHHEIDGGIEAFLAGTDGLGAATLRLTTALGALRRHIYLEEEFLFPPLRASGMLAPLFVMLSEHRELWQQMARLDEQLAADASLAELRETCTTLLAQLDRHNTKEEPIIYGQADAVLSEDARAELHDFIAHEALPPGWACQGL